MIAPVHPPVHLRKQDGLRGRARHGAQHPIQLPQHCRIHACRHRRRSRRGASAAPAAFHQQARAARQPRLQRGQRRRRRRSKKYLRLIRSRHSRIVPVMLFPSKKPEKLVPPNRSTGRKLPLLPAVRRVKWNLNIRDGLPVQIHHGLPRRGHHCPRRLHHHGLAECVVRLSDRSPVVKHGLPVHVVRSALR